MRPPVYRLAKSCGDPERGTVRWAPAKSLWINFCGTTFLLAAPFATTLSSVVVFVVLTYFTLLLGHSVGMHRKLIHRSWECAKWLERTLVYLGVLVGMAGPFGVIRIHDVRDWAQRAPRCHVFFSHRAGFLSDAFWQLNCRFEFDDPPLVTIEGETADDRFYRFLERAWILQQLPLGLVLFAVGGWPWVVWGVFGRVFVSVVGHWTVTYLTHNPGPGAWLVRDAGVQASNLVGYGFITMGECWHNNHHAFPESARIGLAPDEFDPGWSVIRWFETRGLAWNVGRPRGSDLREDLTECSARKIGDYAQPPFSSPNPSAKCARSKFTLTAGSE